ncbi:MAG: hypothetical protein DRZ76_02265 [Candidatus Nealsonbacteria bacterium]|nr:MAG: hypothetical protein DRZ76_02265 [Candidatus Nealsonbacteria bacterium]
MARYTVPKFIEHKAKIVGPLTFGQFLYIGGAAVICFILYFTLPFFYFIMAALPIMLVGAGLAFGKIEGRSLPTILKNFIFYSFGPKIYLWKKKTGMPPKLKEEKEKPKTEESEKTPVPTAVGKSKLKDLSTYVETGNKIK